MKHIWLVVLLPLLASCGVVQSDRIAALSPYEMALVSNQQICQGLLFNRQNINLITEANRRGLGDCSADHNKCISWGAAYGTPEYADCRSRLAAAESAQAIATQTAPAPQPDPSQPFMLNGHMCAPTGAGQWGPSYTCF